MDSVPRNDNVSTFVEIAQRMRIQIYVCGNSHIHRQMNYSAQGSVGQLIIPITASVYNHGFLLVLHKLNQAG